MSDSSVIVVGGGIAGLTAAALLARDGVKVTLLEAHQQTGGCAGTFRRRGPWVFDVGATQVAGSGARRQSCATAEASGHASAQQQSFWTQVVWSTWAMAPLPFRSGMTRKPGPPSVSVNSQAASAFWSLCHQLHASNWQFASQDPCGDAALPLGSRHHCCGPFGPQRWHRDCSQV